MELFIVFIICALQIISGNEDILKQEIKLGNDKIEKQQKDWQENIIKFNKALKESVSKYSTELKNIAKVVKNDADKLNAFLNFKNMFANYVSVLRNYSKTAKVNVPKSIAESFQPSELFEFYSKQITNAVSALKSNMAENTCKENSVAELIKFAVAIISETNTCILDGVELLLNFPVDMELFISTLPNTTIQAIDKLNSCSKTKGSKCFNILSDEGDALSKFVATSGKICTEITKQKKETNNCLTQVKATFDSKVNETSEKIKEC